MNSENCDALTRMFARKGHRGCKNRYQGPSKIHQKSLPDQQSCLCGQQKHRNDVKLTVGALFLGGSGKGRLHGLGVRAAPIAEISLSNMVLTVVLCTRVTCGGSLACMHVRMYCKQKKIGSAVHISGLYPILSSLH